MANSKIYYVWINALTSSYAEAIVGRLVRRNWHVGALGSNLVIHSDDKPSSLVAFSVQKTLKEDETITYSTVFEEVKDVLKVLKAKYFSMVITESTGCTWQLGNISIADTLELKEIERRGLN